MGVLFSSLFSSFSLMGVLFSVLSLFSEKFMGVLFSFSSLFFFLLSQVGRASAWELTEITGIKRWVVVSRKD